MLMAKWRVEARHMHVGCIFACMTDVWLVCAYAWLVFDSCVHTRDWCLARVCIRVTGVWLWRVAHGESSTQMAEVWIYPNLSSRCHVVYWNSFGKWFGHISAAQFTICVMPKAWSSVLFEVGIMPEINRNGVISLTTCGVNCCNIDSNFKQKESDSKGIPSHTSLFFAVFSKFRGMYSCSPAGMQHCCYEHTYEHPRKTQQQK